jgi:hypothetical protein
MANNHLSVLPKNPILSPLVSYPVQTISISDLGKEISRLKTGIKKAVIEEHDQQILSIEHQKFHVLLDIMIKGKQFRLKTLLDTGYDLNLLNKEIILVQFWQKTHQSAIGLGNQPTQLLYEIPKETLCFQHHCLSLKFLLT